MWCQCWTRTFALLNHEQRCKVLKDQSILGVIGTAINKLTVVIVCFGTLYFLVLFVSRVFGDDESKKREIIEASQPEFLAPQKVKIVYEFEAGQKYFTRGSFIAYPMIEDAESGDLTLADDGCEVEFNRILEVVSHQPGVGVTAVHWYQDEIMKYRPIHISNAPADCDNAEVIFLSESNLSGNSLYSEVLEDHQREQDYLSDLEKYKSKNLEKPILDGMTE